MTNCKIDHSLNDVRNKLDDQTAFIPAELLNQVLHFIQQDLTQEQLNELFHLLKKYDLSTDEEREIRNQKIKSLLN